MRISDWSSDVCSSDLTAGDTVIVDRVLKKLAAMRSYMRDINMGREPNASIPEAVGMTEEEMYDMYRLLALAKYDERYVIPAAHVRSEEHTSELQSLMRISYAVFCLKKKKTH